MAYRRRKRKSLNVGFGRKVHRKKISSRKSRRLFGRTARKVNRKNYRRSMRGGVRF